MIEKMKKISIVGGPGTGKSTLARNLGKELNLPVCHIDGIEHLKNWEKRSAKERDEMILEKVAQAKWVIDGTYQSTLEARIQNSDMVIFLDYSAIARLRGILSRYRKTKGKERPEIPGCKEKITFEFIQFAIEWNHKKGKIVRQVISKNSDKPIIIFKNRKKLNQWYKKEFNQKIELDR